MNSVRLYEQNEIERRFSRSSVNNSKSFCVADRKSRRQILHFYRFVGSKQKRLDERSSLGVRTGKRASLLVDAFIRRVPSVAMVLATKDQQQQQSPDFKC